MSTERTPRHPAFLLGVAQKALEDIELATTLDEAKAMARRARHDIDRPVRGSEAAVRRGRAAQEPTREERALFQGQVAHAQGKHFGALLPLIGGES
jgi:hypothetical protein